MGRMLYTVNMPTLKDRAAGAIMGALIGDALGLGCHWYYDLDELHRLFGPWISDYTEPKPGGYHSGMKAGELSQAGLITVMLLESVIHNKGYVESDFTKRLDEDLFPKLDGTPKYGPGGYTSQSIREAYYKRVVQKKSWDETGGHADTTEGAERALVLGALFPGSPETMARAVISNTVLTQNDEAIVSMTTAYCSVLNLLVSGEKLDSTISSKLMKLVQEGKLPFHTVSSDHPNFAKGGQFSSPDALLTPSFIASIAHDPDVSVEPASKIAQVYGLPCAIYHQLPATYYLASRFSNDFEQAVLSAINGGGQNMARAMLTGALVGAQVGLSSITARFIKGLVDSERLLKLVNEFGELVEENSK